MPSLFHFTLRPSLINIQLISEKKWVEFSNSKFAHCANDAMPVFHMCGCLCLPPIVDGGREAYGLVGYRLHRSDNLAVCDSLRFATGNGLITRGDQHG
jgi:hypothetical protein